MRRPRRVSSARLGSRHDISNSIWPSRRPSAMSAQRRVRSLAALAWTASSSGSSGCDPRPRRAVEACSVEGDGFVPGLSRHVRRCRAWRDARWQGRRWRLRPRRRSGRRRRRAFPRHLWHQGDGGSCDAGASRTSALTRAPLSRASWIANRPTPPFAPVTSTRLPSTKPATSSARSAVIPAVGKVAACASDTTSGIAASLVVEMGANCAQAAASTRPTTRAPSRGPLPSAARSTTPAASQPMTEPSRSSGRRVTSPRLSENARTRTTA